MKSISPAARAELFALFPELMSDPNPRRLAALCPHNRQQRQLNAHHKKNKKPLLCLQGPDPISEPKRCYILS